MKELAVRCREHGMRVTKQRVEIFREILQSPGHLTAESVLARARGSLPQLSLDTVYRTIASLESLGLVSRVSPLCGSARFDSNTRRHHHLVCTQCGSVTDFYSDALDRFPAPAEAREWGRVRSLHAEFRGTCAKCLDDTQWHDRPAKNKQQGE